MKCAQPSQIDSKWQSSTAGRWHQPLPSRRWWTSSFGLPVAGFAAPPGGPTLQAARAAMGNFQEIVRGRLIRPRVPGVGPALAEEIGHMADAHEGAAPPGAVAQPRIPVEGYQSLLLAWAGMHGFACLEAFGYFDWLSEQARDELFRSQTMLLTHAIGGPLPEPSPKPVAQT